VRSRHASQKSSVLDAVDGMAAAASAPGAQLVLGKAHVTGEPGISSSHFPWAFFFLIAVGEQTKLSRVPQCCKHWQATK
jgi:hypothetical protein